MADRGSHRDQGSAILGLSKADILHVVRTHGPIHFLYPGEEYLPCAFDYVFPFCHAVEVLLPTGQRQTRVEVTPAAFKAAREGGGDSQIAHWERAQGVDYRPCYIFFQPRKDGKPGFRVDFYYFFALNKGKNGLTPLGSVGMIASELAKPFIDVVYGDHFGDWEHSWLVFDSPQSPPVRVGFQYHGQKYEASPTNTDVVRDTGAMRELPYPPEFQFESRDGHVVFYMSRGGHGTYPQPGSFTYVKRRVNLLNHKVLGVKLQKQIVYTLQDDMGQGMRLCTWKQCVIMTPENYFTGTSSLAMDQDGMPVSLATPQLDYFTKTQIATEGDGKPIYADMKRAGTRSFQNWAMEIESFGHDAVGTKRHGVFPLGGFNTIPCSRFRDAETS